MTSRKLSSSSTRSTRPCPGNPSASVTSHLVEPCRHRTPSSCSSVNHGTR
jgi:hypothetical protein